MHRYGDSQPHTFAQPNAFSDADTIPNPNAFADADTVSHSFAHAHAFTQSNPITHTHHFTNPVHLANSVTDSDSESDANVYPFVHPQCEPATKPHALTDAHPHGRSTIRAYYFHASELCHAVADQSGQYLHGHRH